MDYMVFDKLKKAIEEGKKCAMAIIVEKEGSTPRNSGSIMIIDENDGIHGTIGGGELENSVIKQMKTCIRNRTSQKHVFELNSEGDLHMICGGRTEVFIKYIEPPRKLIIIGAGHIGKKLNEIAKAMGYYTAIIDDREEFCSKENFPNADELIVGNIEEKLINYPMNKNCYVVIVTRGHQYDEAALKIIIDKNPSYIGMIGSTRKTKAIFDHLKEKGISEERLSQIYAPIGLALGGDSPEDIALCIIAEIQKIIYSGHLAHKKELDAIKFNKG